MDVATQTNELEMEWQKTRTLLKDIAQNNFISMQNSPKPVIIFEKCNEILKSSDQLSRIYKATSLIK